jgi:hypothetical protein
MEAMRLVAAGGVAVGALGVGEGDGGLEVQEVLETLRASRIMATPRYSLELTGILSISVISN